MFFSLLGDDKRLLDLMPLVKKRVYNINAPDEDWCYRSALHVACSNGKFILYQPKEYRTKSKNFCVLD